jgi:aubergine-like protein
VWPGFYSAMNNLEIGPLMQIDLTSKVCRKDKVIDHLKELVDKKGYDHSRVNEEFKGMTVVTSYSKAGKHTYKIDRVDFEKSPRDTFEKKDGSKISFADYFSQQYGKTVNDLNQPLLVVKDRRTENEIYLIPEICEMTGLTDTHRANFNLMKELSSVLHKNAQKRIQDVDMLIAEMGKMEKVKKIMDEWKIEIKQKPLEIKGQQMNSGDILMDKNVKKFTADCNPNEFDRAIQN